MNKRSQFYQDSSSDSRSSLGSDAQYTSSKSSDDSDYSNNSEEEEVESVKKPNIWYEYEENKDIAFGVQNFRTKKSFF